MSDLDPDPDWPLGATIQYEGHPLVVSEQDEALLVRLVAADDAELTRLDKLIAQAQRDRAQVAVRLATLQAERDRRDV